MGHKPRRQHGGKVAPWLNIVQKMDEFRPNDGQASNSSKHIAIVIRLVSSSNNASDHLLHVHWQVWPSVDQFH
jgi:hypothetical protein